MENQPKEILLLRHLEDAPDTTGERNPGLLAIEAERVHQIAKDILEAAEKREKETIRFITSTMSRAQETTELVANDIHQLRPEMGVITEKDDRLRAQHHGRYNPDFPQEFAATEKMAWKRYVEQTFEQGDMTYRHGDPLVGPDGQAKFPELVGAFQEFGENQIEFSIRTYRFMMDLVKRVTDQQELTVISSHTAPLLRIGEISSLAEQGTPPIRRPFIPAGKLPQKEWGEVEKILTQVNALKSAGSLFVMDLQPLADYESALDSETAFLEALQAQLSFKKAK